MIYIVGFILYCLIAGVSYLLIKILEHYNFVSDQGLDAPGFVAWSICWPITWVVMAIYSFVIFWPWVSKKVIAKLKAKKAEKEAQAKAVVEMDHSVYPPKMAGKGYRDTVKCDTCGRG
jgi:phosphotransferase system  glucose/maltose/N-acetylglucosamine-specific IIC component